MPAFSFRMRQLPKAEYQLMKMMIDHFELDDASELFTILLRLGEEVYRYQDGVGEQWITQIISTYRSDPTEVRSYEL